MSCCQKKSSSASSCCKSASSPTTSSSSSSCCKSSDPSPSPHPSTTTTSTTCCKSSASSACCKSTTAAPPTPSSTPVPTPSSPPSSSSSSSSSTTGPDGVVTLEGCPSQTDRAGKADGCIGCPGRELCLTSVSAPDPAQDSLDVRMRAIKKKVLVLSGKGGVGKSTVASQLAIALSERGLKVGVLDLDICGPSMPRLLGIPPGVQVQNSNYGWKPIVPALYPTIKVMSVQFLLADTDSAVVWRGPRKTGLIKQFLKDTYWGRLDYLIVDTPPGTSDEHLSIVSALKNARPDGAVMVTTPQELALSTVRKEMSFCAKMDVRVLGFVENMSGFACPCCDEVYDIFTDRRGGDALCKEYNLPLLGRIPLDKAISESGDAGRKVVEGAGGEGGEEGRGTEREGEGAGMVGVSASVHVRKMVDEIVKAVE
eukprot:TRINITY_DN5551_c0_g1_i1.p1 TRINITY_DN5551_c0_g1~~TRINITY_DN5551_c0_g1_i1.p1  ORF type:complete len:425 (+),score=96.39 TRINITY_DN5551_c0_g1_i1:186-1460(+)